MRIIFKNSKFYKPAQREILHDSKKRFKVLKWARRGGKTRGARRWLITQAYDSRRLDLPCFWVSPTIEMARKVFDHFLKEYGPAIKSFNISRRQIILFNSRPIFFCGCDKPASLEGEGLWALVFDECRHIKTDKIWLETLTPMLGDAAEVGGGLACLLSTPRGKRHWFSRLVADVKSKKLDPNLWDYSIKSAVECGILSPQEIERARKDLPPDIFSLNYLAVDVPAEGLVYKEFGDHNIIQSIDEIPFHIDYHTAGIDWGENFALVILGHEHEEPRRQRHVLRKTIHLEKSNLDEILEILLREKAKYGINTWYIDHNRPDYAREMADIGLGDIYLAKKDVDFGIKIVRAMLYNRPDQGPRFWVVEEDNEFFLDEIESYEMDPKTELPKKEFDHSMDAIRYDIITPYPAEDDTTAIYDLIA